MIPLIDGHGKRLLFLSFQDHDPIQILSYAVL